MSFKIDIDIEDLERLNKVLKARVIEPTGTHIKEVSAIVPTYLINENPSVIKRSIYIDQELQRVIDS